MRIVFMGTPEFAVPALALLDQSHHEVVGVVTAPDRKAGRGQKWKMSAVKEYAQTAQIPVLQPIKLRDPDFLESLAAWKADIAVVVAFRMLPKLVWALPRIGTFNLHASLLPDYRGAAPINWVLINGEQKTGLTTFMIDEKIDTGSLLLQKEVAIEPHWTAGDLHDLMMEEGAQLVLETANGLAEGLLVAKPQDHSLFQNPAPKIFREDCEIDWHQPARQIYNFIRGLSPYPTAWTHLDQKIVKIYQAGMSSLSREGSAGTIFVDSSEDQLYVRCADEWLNIQMLQLEGKKRLNMSDFLRGYKGKLDVFV